MAFNDKAIVAFKNLLGKSQTDSTKELGNEAEGIFFNVHASTIWLDSISAVPATAVTQGVTVLINADLTLDPTSNGHAYFATYPVVPPAGTDPITGVAYAYGVGTLVGIAAGQRVRNAISPSFGFGYEAKPFDTGANAISVGDVRDWLYQYNSGIFFQQDNVGLAPATIQVYVYTGQTLANLNGGGGAGTEWLSSVLSVLDTPPVLPSIGDRYLIAAVGATGAWATHENKITEWDGASWIFTVPTDGTTIKVDNQDDAIYHYDGIFPAGIWVQQEVSQVRAGAASGTDTYTVTVAPPLTAYETDGIFLLTFQNNNTGVSTLDVNGLGVKTIKKADAVGALVDLIADDIRTGIVYMLTYDGTYFQIASGAGSGTIGLAEDGDYTDGLFTDFVPTTPIGTAVDRFNEILKNLVPPNAPVLSDWDGVKAGTHVNGNLSFDDVNPIAGSTYIGANNSPLINGVDSLWSIATTPNAFIRERFGICSPTSGDITATLNYQVAADLATPNPAYAAQTFGNANLGELKIYINGIEDVSKKLILSTLTALDSTSGGTDSGLTVSAANPSLFPQGAPFTFYYNRTGTVRLKMNHPSIVNGYNHIEVVHVSTTPAFSITLKRMEFIVDHNNDATAYSGAGLGSLAMTGSKKLSGIDYHTGGTALYSVLIDNAYRNTYSPDADAISFTGNSNSYGLLISAPQQALAPSGGDELLQVAISGKVGTITSSGRRIINGSISLTTNVKRTIQGNTSGGLASIGNILLDNIAASSTAYLESFNDEAYRLKDGIAYDLVSDITSNAWDSLQSLNDGSAGHTTGLQVMDGKLIYPSTAGGSLDFQTTNILNGSSFNNGGIGGTGRDYTGLTGNRTYIRYFRQVAPTNANFTILINGSGGTFVSAATALTGNNIHVEIKCPTETGWMDAYSDFSTNNFADGDGARSATLGAGRAFGTLWGLTIGTKNTANSSGYMVVKITVGPSFTGNITDMTFAFV